MAAFASALPRASMDLPQTQHTAPVLEYRCLYTQDLRRKQKRWQDGRLKYHTFNKRVMVYDERSNFIGDTHWREDSDLAEGDEVELERGGFLVEVADCVGTKNQDLTELLDKRVKDRVEREAAKVANGSPSRFSNSSIRPPATPAGSSLTRPKPLNAILTPSGHYGKAAVPTTSPFEQRQQATVGNGDIENERPTKKARRAESVSTKSGYAQNLMGATLNLTSSKPPSTATIRYETVRVRPTVQIKATPAIDLTMSDSEPEEASPMLPRNPLGDVGNSGQKSKQAQKRRTKPAKERNGYASNLTGAVLSLSRPESVSSKSKSRSLQSVRPPSKILSNNSSMPALSECADNSLVDSDTAGEGSHVEIVVDKIHKRRDNPTNSSRPRVEKLRKPVPSKTDKTAEHISSSIIKPATKGPKSTLRLKSRPPRQIMMLMDRPLSRPKVSKKHPQKGQTKSSALKASEEEVALSQASKDLEAFCKKQKEELRDCMKHRRQPSPEGVDVFSEDEGLDHHRIDALLSKNTKPKWKRTVSPAVEPVIDRAEGQPKVLPNKINNSSTFETTGYMAAKSSVTEQNCLSADSTNSATKHHYVTNAENKDFDEAEEKVGSLSAAEMSQDTCSRPEKTPPAEPDKLHSKDITKEETLTLHESIAGSPTFNSPEQQPLARPQEAQEYSDPILTGACQAATDRFRAMIKSSPGLSGRMPDDVLFFDDNQKEKFFSPTSGDEQSSPGLHDSVVKTAPTPSGDRDGAVVASNLQVDVEANEVGAEVSKPVVVPAPNPKITASTTKPKLPNPATRGKSVQQLAASTVDVLGLPPFNGMPPPPAPPPKLKRSEPGPAIDVLAEDRTTKGPWSRESFDLFGSWTPPGRNAITSAAVNG